MSLLNFFRKTPPKSPPAAMAKERLQIVLAHERKNRNGPDYIQDLKKDLLKVVAKYEQISDDKVDIKVDDQGDFSMIEINIELPDRYSD